jgi:hypothetical protein
MNGQPAGRRSGKKSRLTFLLKLLFSLAILAFLLLFKASIRDILKVLGSLSLPWLAAALSLHSVGLLASAYRWRILAQAQGDEIPLGYLVKSYLVGTFFSNFLPSSVGGDIVRIWDGSRYSKSLLKSSAIVVVERSTGIIVLFLFALAASLLRLEMARDIPVIWVSLIIGLLGLAFTAFFLTPLFKVVTARLPDRGFILRLKQKVLAFRETIIRYREQKNLFLKATSWAFILQVNVVFYFFIIGKAFGLAIPFLDYFIFVPIVLLVQLIPVTINGLGVREGSYIEIFSYYSIPSPIAFSFSLIDLAFRLLLGAAGGIIYVLRK